MRECAKESAQYERELWAEQETTDRAAALAAGSREITLSEEELEDFRALVQPLYTQYGGTYLDLVERIQNQ